MATSRIAARTSVITRDFSDKLEPHVGDAALLDDNYFSCRFAIVTNNNVGNISASGREDFYRWQALKDGEYIGTSRGNVNTTSAYFAPGAILFGDALCFSIKQDLDPSVSQNIVFTPAVYAAFANTGPSLPVSYNIVPYGDLRLLRLLGGTYNAGVGPGRLYQYGAIDPDPPSLTKAYTVVYGPDGLTFQQAFEREPGVFYDRYCNIASGSARYTLARAEVGLDAFVWRLFHWTPTAIGPDIDAQSFEYEVTLSDPDDNALWLGYLNGTVEGHYHTDERYFQITLYTQDEDGAAQGVTSFIIQKDFSGYQKVNVVYVDPVDPSERGPLGRAYMFLSAEDEAYLYCRTIGPVNPMSFIVYGDPLTPDPEPEPNPDPDPDPEPEDGDPVLRSWGFTLDDHDFYVSRLGQQNTMVYAARAEDWTPWQSHNSTVWRGHQGFNWLGMSGDNYAAGAKTNVVVGDDQEGILWTLDPGSGLDDSADETPEPLLFTRVVSAGIPKRGRGGVRNDAVYLTIDLGNPASILGQGASIYLETSDDNGKTWVNQGQTEVDQLGYAQEIFWRSLGVVRAPGRLFRFSDYGATLRIDGADIRMGGEE